jgi:uncharacterized protein YfaS (alpha-2-macroglobulin family)
MKVVNKIPSYKKGETVTVNYTVRDTSGVLADPSNGCTCKITNPKGSVQVNDLAMTKDSTGVYVFRYTPTSSNVTGLWWVKATATHGSIIEMKESQFILEE